MSRSILIISLIGLFLASVVLALGGTTESLAIATIFMAIIIFVQSTILKENIEEIRKDRYVNFLDKRLENLYTPLLNLESEFNEVLEEIINSNNVRSSIIIRLKNLGNELRSLRRYSHLGSNELKNELENFIAEFMKIIDAFVGVEQQLLSSIGKVPAIINKEIISNLDIDKCKELKGRIEDILKLAEKDANKYRERLIELRDW